MAEQTIKKLGQALKASDAVLVLTGAGMGVDSGLGTFRGVNAGIWEPLKALGMEFPQMSNPEWFLRDPTLAWAFWQFRYKAYTSAAPHNGYHLLAKLHKLKKYGVFSTTSNIDGHWRQTALPANRVYEVHGTLTQLQCSQPCSTDVWETPTSISDLPLTENKHRIQPDIPLPKCPKCESVARPNVLMFGDGTCVYDPFEKQSEEFYGWMDKVQADKDAKIFVIEIGAGQAVMTIRMMMRQAMERFGTRGTYCRVNIEATEEADIHLLNMSGREAIEAITKESGIQLE